MPDTMVAVATHCTDMVAGSDGKTNGTSAVSIPPIRMPKDAAGAGQGDGFEGELQQDVALARTYGLAHANLAGALGDRDEHDIHHPHAAHDERDTRHRKHEDEDAAGKLVPGVAERILAEDGEVVGLTGST